MATNDFLPFATGGSANVLTQAQWAALAAVTNGFQSGVADSKSLNKAWRQSSIMSAVLAQFIADQTGVNSVDDGTTATLLANMKKATAGRLLNVQVFVSSGTYTPTPGTTSVIVECQGAGGGSGGANATGAGQVSMGGGGGSGVYGKGRYSSGFAGASVVVGAGGAAGGTGGNGGATSFGALMTVGGGFGGPAGVPFTPPGGTARGLGGTTGTGANIVSGAGQPSSTPIAFTTTTVLPSNGGASNFGSGGVAGISSPGAPGASVGSGAGGSYIGPSSSAVNGAVGSSGIVIIWEYA